MQLQTSARKTERARNANAFKASELLPSHQDSMLFITSYFSSWEQTYRVIHSHTFWKRCFDTVTGFPSPSLAFTVLTLAVILMGQRVVGSHGINITQTSIPGLQTLATWIDCVQCYCDFVIDNHHLDLTAMQTLCLLTMYTTTYCDRVKARYWARRLVLCAVRAKMHLKSSNLDAISDFDAEIRRRLWAAILEVNIQVSLNHGEVLPWTASIEYDVNQPSSLDDVQIHPFQKRALASESQPESCFQGVLYKCGKLRIQILKDMDRIRRNQLQPQQSSTSYVKSLSY
ncbi:hypothetical protein N7488_005259 [Penicillium malachiteum]|nr:hypothetical protein N7488_005259 [Penicillium malachiteum]